MKLLPKEKFNSILPALKQVAINHLFAQSVLERKVDGNVIVDDIENPTSFYVIHPYGMGLIFGDSGNASFNSSLREYALNTNRTRDKHEYVQAYPPSWNTVLERLFGDALIPLEKNDLKIERGIVELNTRVNFRFDKKIFQANKPSNVPDNVHIIRTDANAFKQMAGTVVPVYFWRNEQDFLENGVGFSLYYDGNLASTAYSAFIHGSQLELGIETMYEYRGKGFAERVCSALIDYCLERDLTPVWACRLANVPSFKLAIKLGFVPTLEIPYYRFSN